MTTDVGPDVHGDVHARGARHDHAVNVLPGGPPAWLREALHAALDRDAGTYPDEHAATEAVARRHGCDPAEVVLLNGAAQGFALLAALAPQAPAVIHPQFTEPDRALVAAGLPPARVVLEPPWIPRPHHVPHDADLVVVGRPVNPTGVLPAADDLLAMVAPGRAVVVDEAFLPFTAEPSLADGGARAGVVVLRSATKHLGIPGLRAGYLVAAADTAATLRAARPAWSVNALALAALRADADRGPDLDLPRRTAGARAKLAQDLRRVVAEVHEGAANFLVARVGDGQGPDVVRRLREEHGIAVRPAGTFPGLTPDHLRITVRGGVDDARLVAALNGVLASADAHPGTHPGSAQADRT